MRIVAPIPQQGGPRITKNPNFFEKKKKSSKTQEICQNQQYALQPEVSNPSGSVVSTSFCKEKSAKKLFFCSAILDHFQTKMFKYETTSSHYFSPRISNLKKYWTSDFEKWGKKVEGQCFEKSLIRLNVISLEKIQVFTADHKEKETV